MKSLLILIYFLEIQNLKAFLLEPINKYNLYFINSAPLLHTNPKRTNFTLSGRFTDKLYKEIRRRIQRSTETPEQRRIRLDKEERSRRDGLLYSPKTSYEIYIAFENKSLDLIREQFGKILSRLKNIGAENIHIYNLGLKSLVRPIKNKYEANFLLINISVYPSLINYIKLKFKEEPGVLRTLILKDYYSDKERRIYRDSNFHIRHPFFNTDVYKPYLGRLKNSQIL